jgi:hypothetical protein
MCEKMILLAMVLAIGLVAPVRAELIGYWKLDEGEGTEFWDETDYWHDGTIDPWNEAKVRWTTSGYDANGLEFVSATDPFTLCDVPMPAGLLNVSAASYSLWMNMPTSFQAWGIIFVLIGQADDHSLEPDGAADVFVGRPIWFGTSGAKLNDNRWHHVAVTYDSSANMISIYVDGKPAATATGSLSDPISTVRIGGPRSDGRAQWRRYIGRLDEVAVWNHTLSAADVKNVFWFGPQWTRYATDPEPANGTAVGTAKVALRWTAGETAAAHHVYVGENADDVRNGAADTDKGTTTEPAFADYAWELGKTYYWRVDEIETDGATTYPGVVWSFTVSAKFASVPVPADGAILVDPNMALGWTAGSGAVSHSVYLGTDPANLPRVAPAQTAATYDPATLEFGTTYYWRVDESDGAKTYTGDVWHFKTTPDIRIADPNLAGFWNFDQDENGVAIDWSGHGRHGDILGDPNVVTGYNLNALAFDGVDDRVEVPQVVGNDFTLMAWLQADTPAPDGTTAREGSGLLWSDHAGGGDHYTMAVVGRRLAFETGPGGNPNTLSNREIVTGEWVHVAVTRTSGGQVQLFVDGRLDVTGDQSAVGARNVASNPRIEIGANTLDGRYFKGLIDEVRAYNRVLTPEEIATALRGNLRLSWNPLPAVGAVVDIHYDQPLSWSAGEGAVEHEVYFGTDKAVVQAATAATAGIYQGRQAETTFSLAEPLVWDTTCYWRVDEIGGNGAATRGNVWTFAVADYLIVDDFESYTDDVGNRVYDTWLDGYDSPENGSQVGYSQEPFAEHGIVHGGRTSMPLNYDNTGGTTWSEAERTWDSAQDWTIHGLDTLVLYVRGRAENDLMPLYVTIRDSAGRTVTVTNADANVVRAADWQAWSIPFAALVPVDLSQVSAMVIGLGNRAQPVSGIGLVFIDDIQVRKAEASGE